MRLESASKGSAQGEYLHRPREYAARAADAGRVPVGGMRSL
jgi:hypothetical protein